MIRYNICPICYEEIIEEYVTECNHKFCKVCITKWAKIKPLCPYCKTGLLKIIFENDIPPQFYSVTIGTGCVDVRPGSI
jgi:hypothetical protein